MLGLAALVVTSDNVSGAEGQCGEYEYQCEEVFEGWWIETQHGNGCFSAPWMGYQCDVGEPGPLPPPAICCNDAGGCGEIPEGCNCGPSGCT
jgi:hypothetical protein